jgi:hypothetical protein
MNWQGHLCCPALRLHRAATIRQSTAARRRPAGRVAGEQQGSCSSFYRHYRGKLRRLLWRLKAADGRPLMALVVVVSGFWKSGRKETEVV